MRTLLIAVVLTISSLISSLAHAQLNAPEEIVAPGVLPISESPLVEPTRPGAFRPGIWSKGVHLLTGLGLNTAVYNSDTSHRVLGLGSNFKADVGWFLNDRLALELGSVVKFNRSDDFLIWDTLFTLGVRYRFHSLIFDTDSSFVRAFIGESPTVIFLGDSKNPLRSIGASRAQINGPVVGFGAGCFFQTDYGLNWFFEWDAAYQWLRYQDAIVDQNDVPVVLQSNEPNGSPKIFSLALNLGLVLF